MERSIGLSKAEALLSQYLEEAERRQTPERFAILAKAFELKAHFGVNELLAAMDESGYHVSRATVYNTVEILCACGILRRHLLESRHASYELAHGNHIHLVCSRCGAIEEVSDPSVEETLLGLGFSGFKTEYFSATVHGLCSSCLEISKEQTTKSNNNGHQTGVQAPE